ncbi:hypothetical protein Ppb6_02863 [Photorhabdus australis subsp. thailandensis]|uniref:Uncharacterized protein n=1 Tax=Photorhabdus australis subsp. thailandensis TaxID=2805096 RepID=A0A1C0U1Z3_9GAMM|nr:hypothetical protein Ppb6_02863 [Photorhabdus australis subsp. thailandensis]
MLRAVFQDFVIRLGSAAIQLQHPPAAGHTGRFGPADYRHHDAAPEVVLPGGRTQHAQPRQLAAQLLTFLTVFGRQQPRGTADTVMARIPQLKVTDQFRMMQSASRQPGFGFR